MQSPGSRALRLLSPTCVDVRHRVAIRPFLGPNQLILAFLKLFARNKLVWQFGHFLAFLKYIFYLEACYEKIKAKHDEIITLNLVILSIKFKGNLSVFHFEDLANLKLLIAK